MADNLSAVCHLLYNCSRLFIRDSDDTNQGQKRLAVLQTLRESFGPDFVHGLSYPLGGFSDIVCCLRKARSGITALPLPANFTASRLASEIVKPPPIRNGTWKVINCVQGVPCPRRPGLD